MNGEMYDLTRSTITTEYDENKELRKDFSIEFYPNKLYNLNLKKFLQNYGFVFPLDPHYNFIKYI